jgi:ferredoxin-NADP reductase
VEGTPPPSRLDHRAPTRWLLATVSHVITETQRAKTIVLQVPGWPGHASGQYVDLRITAGNGYRTERSYSIASPPEDPRLSLTVERLPYGEVSGYLTEQLRAHDELELRGPAGEYFSWRVGDTGPLLLIARGPGLVPLMAMLRHRAARSSTVEAGLLLSARSPEDVLYRDELATLETGGGLSVHYTFAPDAASGGTKLAGGLEASLSAAAGRHLTPRPRIFVCGPAPFIGAASSLLADAGYDPNTIRVQDIAPAGG